MLAHLWRGLAGKLLTRVQRASVRRLASRLGLVETGKAMCGAVTECAEGARSDALSQTFCGRCYALIVERDRRGLPRLDLRWRPVGKRAKSPRCDGSPEDLDGLPLDWTALRADLERILEDPEARAAAFAAVVRQARECGQDVPDEAAIAARGAA